MHVELVPPSEPVTREMILAATKPRSFKRRIRLALYDLGLGRTSIGFPYVFWLTKRKRE